MTGYGTITNFTSGILSLGRDAMISGSGSGIAVANVHRTAVAVSGDSTIYNVSANGVGEYGLSAFAFIGWGGDNTFSGLSVTNLRGTYESVAYTMTGTGGGTIYDCYAYAGLLDTWDFGVWLGTSQTAYIGYSDLLGFDVGIASNEAPFAMHNSVVVAHRDSLVFSGNNYTDSGNNSLSTYGVNDEDYILGTSSVDHIVAGDGDNLIIGYGAGDVIYSGLGSDTFVFSHAAMSVAPDFDVELDQIYLAYHYATSTVSWDHDRHVMMVDGQDYVYMPYIADFNAVNYHF